MSNRAQQVGAFEELISAIKGGRRALRAGVPLVRRTVETPDPPPMFSATKIRILRTRLGLSQSIFARLLAVSPITLQKWEQGVKSPSPQSRRLLEIADQHPEIFAQRITLKRGQASLDLARDA